MQLLVIISSSQRPHDGGRDVGTMINRAFAATKPTSDEACVGHRYIFRSVSQRSFQKTQVHPERPRTTQTEAENVHRAGRLSHKMGQDGTKANDNEHRDPETRHDTKKTEADKPNMRQLRHRPKRSSPDCLPIIIVDPTIHESRPGTRNRARDHKRWQWGG